MKRGSKLGMAALAASLLIAPRSAAQSQTAYRLTIRDAIERGLRANLRILTAQTGVEEAEGTSQRRLASLLPRVRGESYANLQNRNLRAFGISFLGVPAVVGPFSNYDFRVYAEQPLLDLGSYHAWKSSERQAQAARQNYQDARDSIIRQIAALYLGAQSAAARAAAADSRVATAEELYRLARTRHDTGVTTGVDVLRAQVELANEQQRRLEARNAAQQALLALARNIGLRPGAPIELAEQLEYAPVAAPELPQALAASLTARPDYLLLQSQREALVEQQKSSQARYLPRLSLTGNYGGLGRSVGQISGTGVLQATLSVTLFDRDRRGEQQEIESRLRRVDEQLADLQLGIEQEIREALLNLDSAAEEVRVAKEGRALAESELELARERFTAGVTNNLEVITAQDALARAQENHILALSRYSDSKMALARALGATEQTYERYLGKP